MSSSVRVIEAVASSDKDNSYVSLVLGDVEDYLDFLCYWDKPRGITGLFRGDKLLKNALEDKVSKRYAYGSARRKEVVFTSVLMSIPDCIHADLHNAGRIGFLASSMATRHEELFRGRLLDGKKPRYLILPDETLENGCVAFAFGEHVYVPAEHEQPLFEVSLSTGGEGLVPCCWSARGLSATPVGIYAGQSGMRIGGWGECSFVVDENLWGIRAFPYITLFTHDAANGRINIGAGPHDCSVDMRGKTEETWVVPQNSHAENAEEMPPALTLHLKSVAFEDTATFEFHEPSPADAVPPPSGSGTCLRQGHPGAKVVLEGLLLPRLDVEPIRKARGSAVVLKTWVLCFNEDGRPVQDPSQHDSAALTLSANSREGKLYVKEKGRSFEELKSSLDKDGLKIDLGFNDEYMDDFFLGCMTLPTPFESMFLRAEGPTVCGRSDEADFPLRLLSDVRDCLIFSDGDKGSEFDRTLTSSRHAQLKLLEDGKLEVSQLSGSVPVYILGSDNKYKTHLESIADAGGSRQATFVENGEKIVIGGYLLKFVASKRTRRERPSIYVVQEGGTAASTEDPPAGERAPESSIAAEGRAAGRVEAEAAIAPLLEKIERLMVLFLEKNLDVRDCAPGLFPMLGCIYDLLKTRPPSDLDEGRVRELRNALARMRLAGDTWMRATENGGDIDRKIEAVFCLGDGLTTLDRHLFREDFRAGNSALINEIEREIQDVKSKLIASRTP